MVWGGGFFWSILVVHTGTQTSGEAHRKVFAWDGIGGKKKSVIRENDLQPGGNHSSLSRQNEEEGDRYSSCPLDLLFPGIEGETVSFPGERKRPLRSQ